MAIRNIIFDLGGVFINIHYHKTREAFINAGLVNFDSYFQQSFSNPLFAQLERGEIAPSDFYDQFRKETGLAMTNDAIEQAWNAMLGDFRPISISVLPQLKSGYQLYLLSNTNEVHYEAFTQQYQKQFEGHHFDSHFAHAYYSHVLGLRKPDVVCYQAVLDAHGMVGAETLFIDDTTKNIEGAKAAGLQTLWLEPGTLLEDKLLKYLHD